MDEFHWLRPAWFLALPLALAAVFWLGRRASAIGSWRRVVDRELEPYVLIAPQRSVARILPAAVAAVAATLAIVALAGPTWERVPVPTVRSADALVVALDLSLSMNATDLEPSRLTRAKLKLLSMLEQRRTGETALVVFSAHAFTVTPLTTDTRTVSALVASLSTDIMPSRGSRLQVGLEKAATLLRQAGQGRGEILLISDADVGADDIDLARKLARDGIKLSVLGVGTAQGAPIPVPEGGFLLDDAGQVVIPGVDFSALRSIANAGSGRYARLSPDDADLQALFPERQAFAGSIERNEDEGNDEQEADVWREAGVWLAIAVLPFIAFGFRRGWVAVVAVIFVAPLPRAEAAELQSLFLRGDQRGAQALREDEPARAAELFENPEWRAVAQAEAGDYESSANTLAAVDTATAHYNRGRALAFSGQLEDSLAAFNRSLELAPDDEDTRFNRDLVEELLRQQREQQEQQEQQDSDGDSESSQGGEGAESQSGASDSQSEEEQTGESSQDPSTGAQSQSPSDSDSGQPGETSDEMQTSETDEVPGESEPGESEPGEPDPGGDETSELSASLAGDELQEWESEQAADQWLRRVQQDPGGLLRRKFLYQYQRYGVDQDGNYVFTQDGAEDW